tara:strand:- start:499 stop:1728 length:1230 start_codon:yes stop_codon:yes gene_type:complete
MCKSTSPSTNVERSINVIVLNGFLGSGKTTLFRNLLTQSKKLKINLGAIVNDMSELDVDGEILGNNPSVEGGDNQLISIHSCVLSSQQGLKSLQSALANLIHSPTKLPELVIIETSGSCHPMPLVQFFRDSGDWRLTGVFTLVDSLTLSRDFDNGEALIPAFQDNLHHGKRDVTNLLVEQVLFGSHIFLTKTDRVSKHDSNTAIATLKSLNPNAPVQVLQFGNMSLPSLFELADYDFPSVSVLIHELSQTLASENDRPYNIGTRVIKSDLPFHPQRLWDACHRFLDDEIYRSKGFFWLASRDKFAMLWNQAGSGINLEIVGSWRAGIVEDVESGLTNEEISELKKRLKKESGRFGDRHCDLTVIGDKGHIDDFTHALESCFLSESEVQLWREGHFFEDPWPSTIRKVWN